MDGLKLKLTKKLGDGSLQRRLGMETLRSHSRNNVANGLLVDMGEGQTASLRSGSVQDERLNGGKPTLIPFAYNGKILTDPREAIELALASKKIYPAFETNEQATAASKRLSNSLGRKP